jgi:Mg-chelatase subunit ChlD
MRRESKENALDMLRAYDTVVIMDDSASMLKENRWEQACEALSELAQIAATYDRDGVDIHFLNHPRFGMNIKDPKKVRQLFRHVKPQGLTPIANKLDILVGDYVEKLESAARRKKKGDHLALKQIKPVNFIVITDGAPTDEPADSIVSLARRLDRGNFPLAQVGIQFVQIGNDKEATEFLKQLDDDLSSTYGVRDIVDTTPFLGMNITAEMLLKILLGGINRRVDRRGAQAVMN